MITTWFGGACLVWLARVVRGFDPACRALFAGMGVLLPAQGKFSGPGEARRAPHSVRNGSPHVDGSFGTVRIDALV